ALGHHLVYDACDMTRLSVLFVALSTLVAAQEFRGTVQGDVTDPAHAAVANANVSLRNTETGIERTLTTDGEGHYVFTFVAPGNYTLTVRSPGFKTTVRESIQLSINDSLKVDVEMPVGQATESVQVTGQVTAVQAESSSLGSVISEKMVDSLPWK